MQRQQLLFLYRAYRLFPRAHNEMEKGRDWIGKRPRSRLNFQIVLTVDELLEADEVARDRLSGPTAIAMKAPFSIAFSVKQQRGLIEDLEKQDYAMERLRGGIRLDLSEPRG